MDAWVRLHVELAESQPKVLQKLQPTFQPQSIQSSLKVKICCQKKGRSKMWIYEILHDCILSYYRYCPTYHLFRGLSQHFCVEHWAFPPFRTYCWDSRPTCTYDNLWILLNKGRLGIKMKSLQMKMNEKDIQNLCHNKKDISIDSVDIKNSSKMRKRQPELKARKSVGTLTWSTREATANEPNLMSLRLQKGQKSYRIVLIRTNSYYIVSMYISIS